MFEITPKIWGRGCQPWAMLSCAILLNVSVGLRQVGKAETTLAIEASKRTIAAQSMTTCF